MQVFGGVLSTLSALFLTLLGKAGGQTASGGTGSGEDLNLNSTTDAVKGSVNIAGGLADFNEANKDITFLGSLQLNQEEDPLSKDTDTTDLNSPLSVFVSGSYAYVVSQTNNRLSIFDISDDSTVVPLDSITTNLSTPKSLYISGNMAYVVGSGDERLALFDVSDKSAIVAKGTITTGLDDPLSVYASGAYAYVASFSNDTLAIFDISDSLNPIAKDTITTGLNGPNFVYVLGKYAYITSGINSTFAIFDVSDVNNIVAKDTITTGLSSPQSVFVSGSYAYVASQNNNTLAIFDISDPGSIVSKDTTTDGLSTPVSVIVSGRYAYVVSSANDTLAIFDVSDVASIVTKGTNSVGIDNPRSVRIMGKNIYVASQDNNSLAIFEITNASYPSAEVGALKVHTLDVQDNVKLSNDLSIDGALTVNRSVKVDNNLSVAGDIRSVNGHIINSITSGITASTTQTQGQGQLITDINEISVVANNNDTNTMPSILVPGIKSDVINNGANTLQLFPATGHDLGAGTNIPVLLPPSTNIRAVSYTLTEWAIVPSSNAIFGEMIILDNSTALTINSQDKFHAVRLMSAGSLGNFTFHTGSTGSITNTADNGGILRITSATHGLTTGDVVTITGLTTAAQNDVTTITVIDPSTFDCDDIAFVTASETGTWNHGSHLVAGNGVSGIYQITVSTSLSSASANKTFEYNVFLNTTIQTKSTTKRRFGSGDIGNSGSSSMVNITDGDQIWLGIQNQTDTANITLVHLNISLHTL